jgi:transposase-like protein
VIFIDAIHLKIRDGAVANRPIYVALAVTAEGRRDILGPWAGDGGEGAKHWLHILTEIKNRGVGDVQRLRHHLRRPPLSSQPLTPTTPVTPIL